jgi:3'-5' exonuclease
MEALRKVDLKNVVTLDIETARKHETLEIDSPEFDSWSYKVNKNGEMTDVEIQESYVDQAALHPEFARIVCISVGRIKGDKLTVKTYDDDDEKVLLLNFNNDLGVVHEANSKTILAGHAIKGFDAPFIAKRSLINQVAPHTLIDVFGQKPWDLDEKMIDTKDLWKGSSFNSASLINIAVAFGIPSPKSDISGADVGRVYYEEGNTGKRRIVKYCERDVLATANILRKLKFLPLLSMESASVIQVEKEPLVVNLANGGPFEKREQKELIGILKLVEEDGMEEAMTILDAIAAKKSTKLTKTFMNQVRKSYE